MKRTMPTAFLLLPLLALLAATQLSTAADLQQWSVPRLDPESGAIVGTFSLSVVQPTTFQLSVDKCGGQATRVHVSGPQSSSDSGWMSSTVALGPGIHKFNYKSFPARPFGASKIRARAMTDGEVAKLSEAPFRVVQGISNGEQASGGPDFALLCEAAGEDRVMAQLTSENWMDAVEVVRREALGRRADKVQVAIAAWNGAVGELAVQVTRTGAVVTSRDPALPLTHVICQRKDITAAGTSSSSSESSTGPTQTHLALNPKPGHWQAHCIACMRLGKVPAVVTSSDLGEAANAVRLALESAEPDVSDVTATTTAASKRVWIGGWESVPAEGGARPLVLDVPEVPGGQALVVPGSPEDELPYLCQD